MAPARGVTWNRPARGCHVAREHGEENAGQVILIAKSPDGSHRPGFFIRRSGRVDFVFLTDRCHDCIQLVEVEPWRHFDAGYFATLNPRIYCVWADREPLGEFLLFDQKRRVR